MTKIEGFTEKETEGKPYFSADFEVRWEEMDANGHVNYAAYLDYFSEARLMAIGLDDVAKLRKDNIGPVVYKIEVEYLAEMTHPDTARIVTWIDKSIGKTRVSVRQNLYSKKTGKLVTRATVYSIFMDTSTRKPVRMPDILREKFGLI